MNCEICAEKFTVLKDLIQHGTSERHMYSHFFCCACSLSFNSVTDVVEHVASDEHSILLLATGIRFDTKDKDSDICSLAFPPHNFCVLCGFRGFLPLDEHYLEANHKYMVWLMRTIISSKEIHCSKKTDTATKVFINKMINTKQKDILCGANAKVIHGPLPFICEVCNVHFSEPRYYTRHLENQSHKRMEKFMIKISKLVKEMNIIDAGTCIDVRKTFNNAFGPLYYCEVCSLWVDSEFSYSQHRRSNRHRNVALGGIASTSTALVRNRVFKKRKQPLKRKEYKSSEQCLKRKNAVCDCEKASKRLKTSSPLNDPCSTISISSERPQNSPCSAISTAIERPQNDRCTATSIASERPLNDHGSTISIVSQRPQNDHGSTISKASERPLNGQTAAKKLLTTDETDGKTTSPPADEVIEAKGDSSRSDFDADETDSSSEDSLADNDSIGKEHYCELCDFCSYSSLNYDRHLIGKYHRRMQKLVNKKAEKVRQDSQECKTSSDSPLQQ